MLLRTAKYLLLFFFLFNGVVAASGMSPDLRLIQMVPPESRIIASMRSPTLEKQLRSFLLITVSNKIDLRDFYAVTGADASRLIREVVFVAALGSDGTLSEHSLLVSGHFNRDAIFRFTESDSPRTERYRGETILMVPPFVRETRGPKQLRWLAILNSDIAIFGTPESVQRELDRQIAKSRPDPMLMERLSRLGNQDETWCLLPAPSADGVIARLLDKLDPRLAAVAREGGSIQYGLHFGRRIEITASSNVAAREGSTSANDQSAAQSPPMHHLLADSRGGGNDETTAVVKISRRRYDDWLDTFSKGNLTVAEILPH